MFENYFYSEPIEHYKDTDMCLWLFRNHLGEFRYIKSYEPPVKCITYEPILHHKEKYDTYHGSREHYIEFYIADKNKPIEYFSHYDNSIDLDKVAHKIYFQPDIIGDLIPEELINEKYLNLTFDDSPLMIKQFDKDKNAE